MDSYGDKGDLKEAGAELLEEGRCGLRIHGWEIESRKLSILNSLQHQQWESKLETSHLPEMVFGENSLYLKHLSSGLTFHFNAFDALAGWKRESLPPVEVPAASKWKFRSKPCEQVILDYDYTFTTPYCGGEAIEIDKKQKLNERADVEGRKSFISWEDCEEHIDAVSLALKEPILFYDEVVLYEDELADNGISLLTVKVRVMPSCWFLLLRFWLRVDGAIMRLRESRYHCAFPSSTSTTSDSVVILRDTCWRESTFAHLSKKGYPTDASAYTDPTRASYALPVILSRTQKLVISPSN